MVGHHPIIAIENIYKRDSSKNVYETGSAKSYSEECESPIVNLKIRTEKSSKCFHCDRAKGILAPSERV